jgi:hypothetical protein
VKHMRMLLAVVVLLTAALVVSSAIPGGPQPPSVHAARGQKGKPPECAGSGEQKSKSDECTSKEPPVFQDGTLIRAAGALEVYRMDKGVPRWIPNPATASCMGLAGTTIQTVAPEDLNAMPAGPPYPSRTDGTLLQGSGPQTYKMEGCQRHLIPDAATFNAQGVNPSAVVHVADADLSAIPEGPNIPSCLPTCPPGPGPGPGPGALIVDQTVTVRESDHDVDTGIALRNGDTIEINMLQRLELGPDADPAGCCGIAEDPPRASAASR